MSDIDLTEAHKAALDAAESVRPGLFAVGDIAANAAARAVAASAPLIEAAVREQIVSATTAWVAEQVRDGVLTAGAWSDGVRFGIEAARDIARGERP